MKMIKKVLSVLLSLMLVLGAVAVGGMSASADGSIVWNAAENRYEISDYAGLKKFADIVNGVNNPDGLENPQAACATLTQDITADDAAWTPIGNSSNSYVGVFDGGGHKITGLTTPEDYGNYAGLFRYVGEGGIVRNVGLEGGSITGNSYAGGVVGLNRGAVTNCYNTGDVSGVNQVGGVVGLNYGTVTNCYNTGDVSGVNQVGGVAGCNYGTVTNCYNTGSVTAQGNDARVGGVAGFNYGTVTNCYNTGSVSGSSYVGGVAGFISNNAEVKNCYNTGSVSGSSYVGGVVGWNSNDGKASNCYYDSDRCTGVAALGRGSGTNVTGLTTAQMTGEASNTAATMRALFDAEDDNGEKVWLDPKSDGADNGKYYWYYPHLKGFNFNYDLTQKTADEIEAADWPAKVEVNVRFDDDGKYTYDGEPNIPENVYVILGDIYYPQNDTEIEFYKYDGTGWKEPTAGMTGAGTYKMEYTDGGEKVTKVFTMLSTDDDYIVSYQKCIDDAWTSVDEEEAVDAGEYKAVITFSDTGYAKGHAPIEKKFEIDAKPLTSDMINAIDDVTYNGHAQAPGVTVKDGPVNLIKDKDYTVSYKNADGGTVSEMNNAGPYNVVITGKGNYTGTVEKLLKITPKPLESADITIEDIADVTYNGRAQEPVVTVTGGPVNLIKDKDYTVYYSNNVNVARDANGNAIAGAKAIVTGKGNYTGTVEKIFKINPKEVTITAKDASKPYDGSALTQSGFETSALEESDTHEFTVVMTAGSTITDAGTTENVIATVDGVDVTAGTLTPVGNYNVTTVNGTLTVTKAKPAMTLTAADADYGKTVTVTAELPVTATGTVDFSLDNADSYKPVEIVNGKAVFEAEGLSIKEHSVLAVYRGDGNNEGISAETAFNVNSVTCPLTINYVYAEGGEAATTHTENVEIFTGYSVTSPEITGYTPDPAKVEGTMGDADMGGKTVTVTYTLNTYNVTYIVDNEEFSKMEAIFGQPVPQPRQPQKDGYTFAWTDEIPATMPAEDVTVNGQFTAIEYTAIFVNENGETVAEIPYTVETDKLEAPAVPVKEGYNGEWEEYELTPGGITVKPVYTPADICPLDNEYHGDNFWGRLVKFFHTVIWKAFRLVKINVFFKIS